MFHRTENRRVEKRPAIGGFRWSPWDWLKMGGGTLGIVALLFFFFNLFVASSHFTVRELEITGPFHKVAAREIGALASIPSDKNLFFINLYDVGRRVSLHPWVKHVSVRRKFPDTLSIRLTEYTPEAILETGNGESYYLSREGDVFKKLEGDDARDFPKISGFDTRKLEKFPFYYGPQVQEALKFMIHFSELAGNEGVRMAALHHDEAKGYEAEVCRGNACGTVFFGKLDQWKWAAWSRFVRVMEPQSWFEAVDLHVEGKIFARMEKGE